MAVARSSVFSACRLQNAGWAMRRRPPLGDRHAQRVAGRLHRGEEPVGGQVAADLPHPLGEDGIELDPVAVPVDHRMVETRSDLRGSWMTVIAHVAFSPRPAG